jgi:hypothetical protein
MATEKQLRWRYRSHVLWRLKGLVGMSHIAENINLTPSEREKLNKAFDLIREVTDNSTQGSRELGFKAVVRCRYCGKPATNPNQLCSKCYKEAYGYSY